VRPLRKIEVLKWHIGICRPREYLGLDPVTAVDSCRGREDTGVRIPWQPVDLVIMFKSCQASSESKTQALGDHLSVRWLNDVVRLFETVAGILAL